MQDTAIHFLLFALHTHIIVCYHGYYDMLHLLLNISFIHVDFISVKFIGYAEHQVFSPVKCVISGCIFTLIILHTKRILTSKFYRPESCKYVTLLPSVFF